MLTLDYLQQLRRDLRVEACLRDQTLHFDTTWGLFSPKEIDEGTLLLLKYVEVEPHFDCIDLGCGYGPIGLTLARLAPQGTTLLLDKDFVAVDYSRRNAKGNQISNCDCRLSNGFSAVEAQHRAHLIASNLPAKVGKEMLYLYLYDAWQRLHPGGRLYVVTINGLRHFIAGAFREVFGNYKKLKQGRTYTVAMTERREASPLPER